MSKSFWQMAALSVLIFVFGVANTQAAPKKVGVIYVVHGGTESGDPWHIWESTIQLFSYDRNNSIYQRVIWNKDAWPTVASFGDGQKYGNVKSLIKKFDFKYQRVGNYDPFTDITLKQLADMTAALEKAGHGRNIEFITDWAGWITGTFMTKHYPWPRFLYTPQVEGGSPVTYCGTPNDGGQGPEGTWPGCDPERYNVDGPAERLLAQGVDTIVMVDMTTSGVRFVKSYEVVEMTRHVVHQHNQANGTGVDVDWVNDPTDLMHDSWPAEPKGWTRSLGAPIKDTSVPLTGRPNPIAEDPEFAMMMVDGIDAELNPAVNAAETGVVIVNHTVSDYNETFDPKVNDTIALNDNIKAELLRRHPDMNPDNILSGWMGIKVPNPNIKLGGPVRSNLERSRDMRAENLGHAYLYETDKQLPGGAWSYRYWDALALLKDRGVKHIVVIFSQIVTSSVLDMVEVPNQIAKEIGTKTWMHINAPDYKTYPEYGHPFADYWEVAVDTQCRAVNAAPNAEASEACCFELGGCPNSNQPYPPLRQTPIDAAMEDTDPSLAYDISAYGELGYDPAKGPPSNDGPVQDQYTGTWSMWQPPDRDPRLGAFLAKHVLQLVEDLPAQ